MKLPAKYAAARNALAAAARIDEVKEIRNKAIAMEVYAYQAKDRELVALSAEMKKRARRRIGELMEEQRKTGKLSKGTRGSRVKGARVDEKPTLASQGVDKNLAAAARRDAAMPLAKFEAEVAKDVAIAVAAVDGRKEVISAARAARHKEKSEKRAARESDMAQHLRALPQRKYGVILADPEWKFQFHSDLGKTNSSADNHYSTSDLETIKARDVASIAAKDCVLFLWATVPMLPQALEVMQAWGFTYKSNFSWTKNKSGTGYWSRNKHEHLLIGVRGKPPAPAEGTQWPSVIDAPVGRHSEKPEASYRMIEEYFPTLPKIELNQRKARAGWDGWGDEAPVKEAAE